MDTTLEPTAVDAPLTSLNVEDAKRILETALLVMREPQPLEQLTRLFEPNLPHDLLRALLDTLKADWRDRGVNLVQVATGYRFQAKQEMQVYIDRLEPERAPRYSRAIMETLAIIAYRQPCTRGEIEAIRGVAVSTHVTKTLEDREWIEIIGHKESPGRPALFATTKKLLNDLGLRTLSELPPLADLDEQPSLDLPGVPTEPPFPHTLPLKLVQSVDENTNQMSLALSIHPPIESFANHELSEK
jgi:segregation and condensation protein B